MSDTASFGYGQMDPNDSTDEFNKVAFLVQQIIGRLSTMKLVQVQAVNGMTVNVLPLVNQVDGSGNATPHGTVYNIPFKRVQSGANAIIMDPQVGDIGYVVVADRDISSVKNTKKQANPGSARRFDLADGVYDGSLPLLNGTPTQTLQFGESGVTLTTPLATIDGPTHSTGSISTDANLSAPAGQVSGESFSIPGSKIANAGNPMVTAGGGVQLTGGFTETEYDLGTPANGATVNLDATNGQKQKITNNVAGFTLNIVTQTGDVELRIINGASAGTITIPGGFQYPGGSVLDTVNGHQFIGYFFNFGAASFDYIFRARQ